MLHKFNVHKIISLLKTNVLVSKVDILLVDEIEKRGFYKIRCSLVPSRFKFDIKFVKTENEFLYSYQLYSHKAIARWDNEPHYPDLDNFPHHYHHKNEVTSSTLYGNPEKDVKEVFSKVTALLLGEN